MLLTERAPAKINLTLKVLGRRPDRMHELQSIVAFARDAADVLTLDTGAQPATEMRGPFAASIAGQNLLDVTLRKVRDADPGLRLGRVELEKNLPIAAGIGGGSADAAALLRLIARANPERAPHVDWHGIAASLGADVPVCLAGQPAWMTGVGDRLVPLAPLPHLFAVLVNPLEPMPADKTAQVFRALAAADLAGGATPSAAPVFHDAAMLVDVVRKTGNDLTRPAESIVPVIVELRHALAAIPGCRYAAVSGAGPTCFGLFSEDARDAADALARAHPAWWVRATEIA